MIRLCFRTPSVMPMLSIGALSVCSSILCAQVPATWTFELQCRSSLEPGVPAFNLPFPSSLSSQYVSIGEDGGVAIRTILNSAEGVFYGKAGVGGLIFSAPSSGDPVWSTTLDVRNGMIAIEQGSFDDGAQLYDTLGNLIQNFAPGGSQGVSGFSGVTLTSDGAICYRGDFGFTTDKVVIDEYDTGVRTQTLVTDTNSGYSFLFAPEINDARQVVLNTIPTSGPTRRIVRFETDGSASTIAETGSFYNAFVNSVAIAQNGQVAYSARRSSDSIWQVNLGSSGFSQLITDGNNPDINNSSIANFPPVINSNGWVALRATDIAFDSTALWVGDGDDLIKLVEYDQIIETDLGPLALGYDFGGLTGKQVLSGVIDINDNGQVAFSAFFRNGTIGVFVATPEMNTCSADYNQDGQVNFFDVSAFISDFSSMNPNADLTGDGLFNFFDVSAFINVFSMGCP